MKKYITPVNVVVALLVTGIAIQIIVIFFPSHRNEDKLQLLQSQEKQIEQLTKQLQAADNANRLRDSILLEAFYQSTAQRQQQFNQTKKTANEKIDRINSGAFTADSIRRAFAGN